MRRSSLPSSVRVGMFCRLGSVELSRPGGRWSAAGVWGEAWDRYRGAGEADLHLCRGIQHQLSEADGFIAGDVRQKPQLDLAVIGVYQDTARSGNEHSPQLAPQLCAGGGIRSYPSRSLWTTMTQSRLRNFGSVMLSPSMHCIRRCCRS